MPSSSRHTFLFRFLKWTGFVVAAFVLLGALAAIDAFYIEPTWLETTHHSVKVPFLPRGSTLTIAHISDLHTHGLGPLEQKVISALEKEKPDVVVITGDTTSRGASDAERISVLSRIKAKVGVYATRGNWEIWAPMDNEKEVYQKTGITYLLNQTVQIQDHLWMVGIDDSFVGAPDVEKALNSIPQGDGCIALIHSPIGFDNQKLTERCKLVFAGHTHGGQVRIPLWGPIWLPPASGSYVSGWYHKGDSQMYVSRGLGMSILNVRFFCRPELALFILTSEGS